MVVFAPLAIACSGVATCLITLALAERTDRASWPGRDVPADVLLLLVGWALIGAGLWLIGRPGDRATGVLLTTAGFDWFVAD